MEKRTPLSKIFNKQNNGSSTRKFGTKFGSFWYRSARNSSVKWPDFGFCGRCERMTGNVLSAFLTVTSLPPLKFLNGSLTFYKLNAREKPRISYNTWDKNFKERFRSRCVCLISLILIVIFHLTMSTIFVFFLRAIFSWSYGIVLYEIFTIGKFTRPWLSPSFG